MTDPAVEDLGIEIALDAARLPALRLSLEARASDVAVVRQALAGLAEAIALDPAVLADIKTAVSEACNNVVMHAYGGRPGPMEILVEPEQRRVVVTVRDEGRGMSAPRDPQRTGQGVGLSLINALTEEARVSDGDGGGTVVRMRFPVDQTATANAGVTSSGASGPPEVTLGPLLAAVLGRVVAMLAARASFSLDRLSDAQLVSDALSAHAPSYMADGMLRVHVRACEESGSLHLRVGRLIHEGAPRLIRDSELPGVGLLLEQLVDERRVEPAPGAPADGEYLDLALHERAAAS